MDQSLLQIGTIWDEVIHTHFPVDGLGNFVNQTFEVGGRFAKDVQMSHQLFDKHRLATTTWSANKDFKILLQSHVKTFSPVTTFISTFISHPLTGWSWDGGLSGGGARYCCCCRRRLYVDHLMRWTGGDIDMIGHIHGLHRGSPHR